MATFSNPFKGLFSDYFTPANSFERQADPPPAPKFTPTPKSGSTLDSFVNLTALLLDNKWGIFGLVMIAGTIYTFYELLYFFGYGAILVATGWLALFGILTPIFLAFVARLKYQQMENNVRLSQMESELYLESQRVDIMAKEADIKLALMEKVSTIVMNDSQTYERIINPVTMETTTRPLHLLTSDDDDDNKRWLTYTKSRAIPRPVLGAADELRAELLETVSEPIQPLDPRPIGIKSENFSHLFVTGEKDSGKTTFLNATLAYILQKFPKCNVIIADKWNHTKWVGMDLPNVRQMSKHEALTHALMLFRKREHIDKMNKDKGGYALTNFDQNLYIYFIPEINNYLSQHAKDMICEEEEITAAGVVTLILNEGTHTDQRLFVDGQSFLSGDNGKISQPILRNFAYIGLGIGEMTDKMLSKMSKKKDGAELVERYSQMIRQSKYCGILHHTDGRYIPFISPNWHEYRAKTKEQTGDNVALLADNTASNDDKTTLMISDSLTDNQTAVEIDENSPKTAANEEHDKKPLLENTPQNGANGDILESVLSQYINKKLSLNKTWGILKTAGVVSTNKVKGIQEIKEMASNLG